MGTLQDGTRGQETLRKHGDSLWTTGHRTGRLPQFKCPKYCTPPSPCVVNTVFHRGVSKSTIDQYLRLVFWTYIQIGKGPITEFQDWTLSPEFSQWISKHKPSPRISSRTKEWVRDLIILLCSSCTVIQQEKPKNIMEEQRSNAPLSWLVETLREELWQKKHD
jgi:hypothetical protein